MNIFQKDYKRSKQNTLNKLNSLNKRMAKVLIGKLSDDGATLLTKQEFLEIVSTRYTKAVDGIYTKLITSKEDLNELDVEFEDYVKEINFNLYTVILVQFENKGQFESHYHDVDETIYVAKGSYKDDTTGKIYKRGDAQFIPAYTPHSFNPQEDGLAIVTLIKNN